jgi:GMP synthase-like glutamine amidotransferase
MRFLVLQNDPNSPAGMVEERLVARGAALEVVQPMHGGALPPAPDGYAGILVLGGVMSANDDDKYPVLAGIRQLLRDFHSADKPVLGICLGAQILARTFGASVRRHTAFEFGYTPLTFTEAGRRDPLLAGLPNPQWIMESHEDTFDVPAAGATLMTGADCHNQAFRIGRASYGFQCHFETPPHVVRLWMDSFGQGLARAMGERWPATAEQVQRDMETRAGGQQAFAESVADRWLALVK